MALLSTFPAMNLLGNASSSAAAVVSPSSSSPSTGTNFTLTGSMDSAAFLVKTTQVPPNSSQLLNIYVQQSIDSGQTFDDFVSIQIAGKTASQTVALWVREVAPSSSGIVRAAATRSLAANSVLQGPVGNTWRAEAVCGSSASSSQAWQISVSAQVSQ